jgi:phosphosulfolactate synthase (CoM biosynthesis protein A)
MSWTREQVLAAQPRYWIRRHRTWTYGSSAGGPRISTRCWPDKLELLAGHDVRACLGGTLLEIAWSQGKAADCLAWASDVGFGSVEVSRGVAAMTISEKQELIRAAARSFPGVLRGRPQRPPR